MELTLRLQIITVMQNIAPLFEQYSRDLDAVKAHDSLLRAFAAWVARKELPLIRSFATDPPLDECAVLKDWKATRYSASFNLATDAHLPPALVRRSAELVKDASALSPSDALAKHVAARLVQFGISPAQAEAFANQS